MLLLLVLQLVLLLLVLLLLTLLAALLLLLLMLDLCLLKAVASQMHVQVSAGMGGGPLGPLRGPRCPCCARNTCGVVC